MKKAILLSGILFSFVALSTLGSSNAFAKTNSAYEVTMQKMSEEISLSDLPSAVAKAWNDYKSEGDQPVTAYKTTKDDGTAEYEISYTSADGQSQSVKFDEEGNEL